MRDILLEVEKLPFDGQLHEVKVEGHSEEEITYHLFQLDESGLIAGRDVSSMDGRAYLVERLTPEGHRFLNAEAITNGAGITNAKRLVTRTGECILLKFQRSEGSYEDCRSYEFHVEDLVAKRGVICVSVVFTRRAIVNAHNFKSKEHILCWNAIRGAFDRSELTFRVEPEDPDRYIELKIRDYNVEARKTPPDEIVREYLIAKAYWLGYKLSEDPDRYPTVFESEEDFEYLGVTKEDLRRAAWRMREEGLLRERASRMPGIGHPTKKLIDLFEAAPREVVFSPGSQYFAYKHLSGILESAKSSIAIVDNYVDRTLFDMLEPCKENVSVRILTKGVKPSFEHALRTFMLQFKRNVEVRTQDSDVHDRYVVVDDKDFYSLGASLKQAGDKLTSLVKLQEMSATAKLRDQIEEIWTRSSPL
jgi:hypothetical protein